MATTIGTIPHFSSLEEELFDLVRQLHSTSLKMQLDEFAINEKLAGGNTTLDLKFEYTPLRNLKKITIVKAVIHDLALGKLLIKEMDLSGAELQLGGPGEYLLLGAAKLSGMSVDGAFHANLSGVLLLGAIQLKVNLITNELSFQLAQVSYSGAVSVGLGRKKFSFKGDFHAELVELKQNQQASTLYLNRLSSMGKSTLKYFGLSASFDGSLSLAELSADAGLKHGLSGIVSQLAFLGMTKLNYGEYSAKLQSKLDITEAKLSMKGRRHHLQLADQSPLRLSGTVSNGSGAKISLRPGLITKLKSITVGPNYLSSTGFAKISGSYVPNDWNPDSAVRMFDAAGKARRLLFKCLRNGVLQFLPKANLGDNSCSIRGE